MTTSERIGTLKNLCESINLESGDDYKRACMQLASYAPDISALISQVMKLTRVLNAYEESGKIQNL